MSPADPASPKVASGKRGKGVDTVDPPSDRDSEGVYYMSVEDFERRIEPADTDTDASGEAHTEARHESETDSTPEKRR